MDGSCLDVAGTGENCAAFGRPASALDAAAIGPHGSVGRGDCGCVERTVEDAGQGGEVTMVDVDPWGSCLQTESQGSAFAAVLK